MIKKVVINGLQTRTYHEGQDAPGTQNHSSREAAKDYVEGVKAADTSVEIVDETPVPVETAVVAESAPQAESEKHPE